MAGDLLQLIHIILRELLSPEMAAVLQPMVRPFKLLVGQLMAAL
jgi:hypothetical protein